MIHRRTKIFALLGLTFFVVSVSGCVYVFNKLSEKKQTYIEQRHARAELEERGSQLALLAQKLETSESARDDLATRILTDEQVIDFLALIETLGREQGVTFETNGLKVESDDAEFERLVMRIRIEGSYDSVMHTLTIFEFLPYRSSVTDVEVRYVEDGEGAGLWLGEFTLHVVKFKTT